VIAGLRPEHFEDAAVVGDRSHGVTFKANIDVLESMGSEYYAYFTVATEKVSSSELDELAQDAGGADLPQSRRGTQVVARLAAESGARQGQESELFFDSRHLQLFDAESGRSLLAGGEGDGVGAKQPVPEPAATG
jgi:multiple sugar transport system ATP-binding protein